jgi:hypothetical protein
VAERGGTCCDEAVAGELLRHARDRRLERPRCSAMALVLTPSGLSSWRFALT